MTSDGVSKQTERHVPPEYGWRVKLNHEFEEKPRVFVFPRLSQVTKLAGMAYRCVKDLFAPICMITCIKKYAKNFP